MSSAVVTKEIILTENGPAPLATYSQATRAGNTLYCSGCIGVDKQGVMAEGIDGQTEQALKNLSAVVEAGGSTMDNVLKTTVFLSTMDNYAKVNEIYAKYFTKNPPARSCFAVAGLPRGGLVEIEAIALVSGSKL